MRGKSTGCARVVLCDGDGLSGWLIGFHFRIQFVLSCDGCGLRDFTFFALGMGGNSGPFFEANDPASQFEQALLPLVVRFGPLLVTEDGIEPECIDETHQGIQLADQMNKLGYLGEN